MKDKKRTQTQQNQINFLEDKMTQLIGLLEQTIHFEKSIL